MPLLCSTLCYPNLPYPMLHYPTLLYRTQHSSIHPNPILCQFCPYMACAVHFAVIYGHCPFPLCGVWYWREKGVISGRKKTSLCKKVFANSEIENKRQQFWFSVVDAGAKNPNMEPPDNYQTTYDGKNKIVVFYYLFNAFWFNLDLSGSIQWQKDPNILKFKWLNPVSHTHNALSSTTW